MSYKLCLTVPLYLTTYRSLLRWFHASMINLQLLLLLSFQLYQMKQQVEVCLIYLKFPTRSSSLLNRYHHKLDNAQLLKTTLTLMLYWEHMDTQKLILILKRNLSNMLLYIMLIFIHQSKQLIVIGINQIIIKPELMEQNQLTMLQDLLYQDKD